jgi:transcriptional regulator with XRE-family HTH domain
VSWQNLLFDRQLANRTGIEQPQLARIDGGEQLPRLDTLANLAKEAGYVVEIHLIPQSQSGENAEILAPLSIAVTAFR